jgi:CheY-like chemotaxis protein
VLVVVDDPVLPTTLGDLLGASGSSTSSTQRAAWRRYVTLRLHDVDLVLTDLVMPGSGGEELLTQVRQAFPAVSS